LNSGAIKKALDEIQSQNEGIGNYFAEEEQRLLAEIAKQREAVREERARGVYSRDGNEPTMARYKLNRLEYLQRRLREEKTSFERRREQEEKEIDRLGIVGYLKTYSGVKSFGYWRAYELLAEIVDPEGYHRLLTKGLSVKDIDIEELCKSERVVVIEPNSSRKERRVSREMLPNG
jgi:hypothetical protein